MDNNPTPNHQKQCEEMTWKGVTATLTIDWENKTYDMQIGDAPQEEKVSEEKLYSLRGGTPEGYDKLNASLNVVEKQIGGALRRLQVQELKDAEGEETIWPDRPKIQQCCGRCLRANMAGTYCEDRNCPCHSSKEETVNLLDEHIKTGVEEFKKLEDSVFAAPENEHVNNMEGKGKDFTRSPENDSWEDELKTRVVTFFRTPYFFRVLREWIATKKKEWEEAAREKGRDEGIKKMIKWETDEERMQKMKPYTDAAHARGKREERERARKLILQFDQEMTDQNVGDSYFEARNRLMALLEEARNHE